MKNFILLLTIFVGFQSIFSNDNILSKLNQHGYKLRNVRIQLMSYDKDVFTFFEMKPFKYNRTTTVHNCTFRPKVDMGEKTEFLAQTYKFLSNEYRRFPVRFQVNAQKTFKANAMGMGEVVKCGNMTSFLFYKDITYHACNVFLDENKFPPLMPTGVYLLEVTVLLVNKNIAVINVYHEIYIPVAYPKK